MIKRCQLSLCALSLVLLVSWGGCAAPSSSTTAQPNLSSREIEIELEFLVGKPTADVLTVMGDPTEIRAIEASKGRAESWVYRRRIPVATRMVATRMEARPFVDPITGELTTVNEPVLETERITVVEELFLLMQDGQLDSWSRSRREERSYH